MTTGPAPRDHAAAAPVLSVTALRKSYGRTLAVDGVSFAVGATEIVGLLGPNGAGKTTTISMVLGLLLPDAGTVTVAGHDLARERSRALARTGFAAVYAALPGNLTVARNLQVFARLYGVREPVRRVAEVVSELGLERFKDTRCGLLSSGEQTLVSLAKALLTAPALLVLDEPTASLDPARARDIRDRIRAFAANGGAVLWTSHNMHEVEDVCHRVLFLSHGRVLLEGDPRRLPGAHGHRDLEDLFVAVASEPLRLDSE